MTSDSVTTLVSSATSPTTTTGSDSTTNIPVSSEGETTGSPTTDSAGGVTTTDDGVTSGGGGGSGGGTGGGTGGSYGGVQPNFRTFLYWRHSHPYWHRGRNHGHFHWHKTYVPSFAFHPVWISNSTANATTNQTWTWDDDSWNTTDPNNTNFNRTRDFYPPQTDYWYYFYSYPYPHFRVYPFSPERYFPYPYYPQNNVPIFHRWGYPNFIPPFNRIPYGRRRFNYPPHKRRNFKQHPLLPNLNGPLRNQNFKHGRYGVRRYGFLRPQFLKTDNDDLETHSIGGNNDMQEKQRSLILEEENWAMDKMQITKPDNAQRIFNRVFNRIFDFSLSVTNYVNQFFMGKDDYSDKQSNIQVEKVNSPKSSEETGNSKVLDRGRSLFTEEQNVDPVCI